jgi:hypothetical protein
MKMKIRWATIVSVLVLLLFSVIYVQIVGEGLSHCCGKSNFIKASECFDNGEYGRSVEFYLKGVRDTIESGLRWTIGKPHFLRAQKMLYEGIDLYGAYEECELARDIIGSSYDDEGAIHYLCWRIKAEINPDVWMNPTIPIPTKTLEP